MQKEEWLHLKNRGTGQFTDFIGCYRKSLSGTLKKRPVNEIEQDAAKSLSAMANADGGAVFLGADVEGEVTGTFFNERGRKIFMHNLENYFAPPLLFRVEQEGVDGQPLLKFSVAPSSEVHLLKNGKCYLRVGMENAPVSRERLISVKETRRETWHDREVLPGTSLDDLDRDLVSSFTRQCGIAGGAEEILFRPYGLIAYRDGRPLLTRAAVYLFGADALRWHPRPGIEFVHFEGTEKGGPGAYNVLERQRIELPILGLVKEMEDRIGSRIKERLLVRDLFFREKFEYPAWTWKQALLNALAHRDYGAEGSSIRLWMFEDRLEIRSPGRLPPTVQLSNLGEQKNVHYARNPLITRVLVDSGAMPGLGLGLPLIFQAMDRNGLNPPEFKEEGNFFCVTLRNTPVFDKDTQVWLERFRMQDINLRQKRILVYAKAHGMIFNSSDYQNLGVDRDTAYTEIKDLIRRQIVQPFRKHSKVYRLVDMESRITELPGLPWVMEVLEKKGFFTAADLKEPRSVSRETALEMMRNLAEQGFLTATGKGRGLRYFPTDRLKAFLETSNTHETAPEE